jgi:hypothetical protein
MRENSLHPKDGLIGILNITIILAKPLLLSYVWQKKLISNYTEENIEIMAHPKW